ncbi:MAG: ceramidase domain-containing protein [Nocardioides sp.]
MTAGVAVTSVGLLALAVRLGWLGPDIGRGATFCEEPRPGLVRQPANTYSNAGFVLAGLLAAWRSSRPDRWGERWAARPWLPTALACLIVLLGPGSGAMHATQSAWGGHLDTASMYLVAGFAAAYAAMRWLRRGLATGVALFAGFLVLCELAGAWPHEVPVFMFGGNVAFAALLLLAIALETALLRRHETTVTLGFGLGAIATMAVAFGVWNLARHGWCDPTSRLQGHAVWHLLGAVSAYLLFCYYASERSLDQPASSPVSAGRC